MRAWKDAWHDHPVGMGLATVGCFLACMLTVAGGIWASSRPPAPQVREGKVVERQFSPAHDYTYFVQVYSGETCITIGSGTSKSQSCTPHYTMVPMTGHVPDRYYLIVRGCPRRKGDSPIDYCQKPRKRKVQVPLTTYDGTRVGATWTEGA
jgi:hypothetical protein